jgi:hypothetical protein
MKIEILVTAPYTNFESDPPGRVVMLQAGDVINYPDWYGRGLCDAGLAKPVEDLPPASPSPAPIEVKASEYRRRGRRT